MDRATVIRLAQEAGIQISEENSFADDMYISVLYRFAHLVIEATPLVVPDAKQLSDHKSAAYVLGWNECRAAMIKAAPKPGEE